MKIQCSVCEAAEAAVVCCADEAALCSACDQRVHAANKLASKHQRVPLSGYPSQMPKCDICQDTVGYFFCLEDRALLCRKCDVAIHTANPYVSSHRRFLLTGVRVGLESLGPSSSSSQGKDSGMNDRSIFKKSAPVPVPPQCDNVMPVQSRVGSLTPAKRSAPAPLSAEYAKFLPVQGGAIGEYPQSRFPFVGGTSVGSFSEWQIDDFVGFNGFSPSFGCADHGPSKADSGKLGDSDSSAVLRSPEDHFDADECLGLVPEMPWSVPQLPSPPTASGLFWPKTSPELADSAVFVPDIS